MAGIRTLKREKDSVLSKYGVNFKGPDIGSYGVNFSGPGIASYGKPSPPPKREEGLSTRVKNILDQILGTSR